MSRGSGFQLITCTLGVLHKVRISWDTPHSCPQGSPLQPTARGLRGQAQMEVGSASNEMTRYRMRNLGADLQVTRKQSLV